MRRFEMIKEIDEIDEFVRLIDGDERCSAASRCTSNCRDCLKKWLRQEIEEEEGNV